MVVKYTNIGQIPKNVIFSLDNDTLNIKGKYSNIDISFTKIASSSGYESVFGPLIDIENIKETFV